MKILIASDIHGSAAAARQLQERVEEEAPDRIVLLGDLLYHGPRNPLPDDYAPMEVAAVLNGWKDRIVAVRGNCDAEVDQMVLEFPCRADYALIEVSGLLIYATHGHLPGAAPDNLPALPAGSAFLSGHTHVKTLERRESILMLNPGSTSIPKDGAGGYAVYENGAFFLKGMDGAVLSELSY